MSAKWGERELPGLVEKLLDTYADGRGINRVEGHDLPVRETIELCLDRLFAILFPGFSDANGHPVTQANLAYHVGALLHRVHMDLTAEVERAFRYACKVKRCEDCNVKEQAADAVVRLLENLPAVRETLKEDIGAAYEGDPAAKSFDDIILSYPGVEAIATYRLAHELYKAEVPLVPRMWTERAHSRTGIDINPGATIGPRFFIDHGTGVVIGETTEIGRNVALYQGVTLGALAPAKGQTLRDRKRHPTIEDDVVIYAGATILGGETVIGRGAVVGGNVWLTQSVPPRTRVMIAKHDLVFLQPGQKKGAKSAAASGLECPAKPFCEADGTMQSLRAKGEDGND